MAILLVLAITSSLWGQSNTPLDYMPTATDGSVRAIVPDGMGGVYIGGYFTGLTRAPVHGGGAVTRKYIARINADGTIHPWDPNAGDYVLALAVDGTAVYAGGEFNEIGGNYTVISANVRCYLTDIIVALDLSHRNKNLHLPVLTHSVSKKLSLLSPFLWWSPSVSDPVITI